MRSTVPPAASAPVAAAVWTVRLLGGFEIDDGQHRMTRLGSRAATALLARVASAPQRDHAREALIALLWPDADLDIGRNRLRQTLSTLKSVLEPAGRPPVLLADRRVVRAAPGAFWCDVPAFEQALAAGDTDAARALYRGELLPGFYDEWIDDERVRLQALHDRLDDVQDALPAAADDSTSASTSTLRFAPGRARSEALPVTATPGQRLPHYLTRLVGVDQAGTRLLAWVAEHRWVTVLGPGGGGKTRLAVEVAHHAMAVSPGPQALFDGALFVSLIDVTEPTGLLDRMLQALRQSGGGDAVEQIEQALSSRRWLVLLDNAEGLGDAAVGRLAALAAALPAVHWLATSRRPLGLDGERDFPLDALPLPDPAASLDEVAMNPAVVLFVDRARAHRAEFHVSEPQREPLVALVRWLEGLPLAIELAAAQVRTQSPAQLLALLQRARQSPGGGTLDYLARRGARSGHDARHASMRAVVQGSWALLDPAQHGLLSALSTLPSGATAAQAAAIADDAAWPPARAQAVLDALVAHCVLRAQAGTSGVLRYAPYEPVREFALEQMDAAAAQAVRARLLKALTAWARELPATPPLPEVRDELPTLTLVLAQAGADGRADDAARLVLALQSSWGEIALPGGVLEALDRMLDTPGLDDTLAAGCHALAGNRHHEAGRRDDARRHRDLALQRLARCATPEPDVQVMVLSRCARLYWRMERDTVQARALIAQALPIAQAERLPHSEAALLSLEAHMLRTLNLDPARTEALSERSLALWAASGNRHLLNAGRFNLAAARMQAGHHAEVLDEFADLAREGRDLRDWDLAAASMDTRSTALQGLRRWAESAADSRESVRLAWDGMELQSLAYALWNLPPALARLRRGEEAAEVMGAAEVLWKTRFGELVDSDRRDLRRIRRFARVLIGPQAAQAAWQRGAARPLAETVRRVLQG